MGKKMTENRVAIGVDLGGTRIKAVLIDERGYIFEQLTSATVDDGVVTGEPGELWKVKVYESVQELIETHQQKIDVIGLAAPGIPNETNDCINHMPGRLQGLEKFNWTRYLGTGDTQVSVMNDAQAALVAEHALGAGQAYGNLIMLTLGTGVGGAIMIDGELYQGNIQRAGHFGHMSLNTTGVPGITGTPGSLEDAIGNATLTERSSGVFESTEDLVAAFRAEDHFASWLWLNSVRNLSIGIAALINVFSPQMIILGGGIAQADEALFEPLEQFLDKYEWRPDGKITPVKKAKFHHFAGAIGAAIFALHKKLKTES